MAIRSIDNKTQKVLPKPIRPDPRIRRTRQLLQKALADLMAEHPFSDISVQDITAKADINRATFYAHFEDKYALLSYTMRESLHAILKERLPAAPLFTIANLRTLMLIVHEFLVGRNEGHCPPISPADDHMLMMVQVQAIIYEVIVEWLNNSQSVGSQPTILLSDTAAVTSWFVFGVVIECAKQGRRIAPEQTIDRIMPLLSSGVLPYLVND